MTRRWIVVGLAAVAIAMVFWAGMRVGSRQGVSTSSLSARPEKSVTYAMIGVVSGAPFWLDTRAAWSAAGESSSDVRTIFGGPNDTDAQKQIDEIEVLLAKRIDGLIVSAADSAALVPTIDKAVDQGIPVITYFIDAPKSRRLTYVASELEGSSIRMGEFLTAKTEHLGKAIIVYAQAGNTEQEARRRGFEELIKRYPGLPAGWCRPGRLRREEGGRADQAAVDQISGCELHLWRAFKSRSRCGFRPPRAGIQTRSGKGQRIRHRPGCA
jgi:ABC-type sugar transport system substrate-binding protein